MTTMRDIVTRALRKIGVADISDTPSAADMDHGLSALNAMMHAWKLRSVDIEHATLEENDEFPMAAEYEEGTTYLLASRLSPDYQVPEAFDADDWFRAIQAAYMVIDDAAMPVMLNRLPSRYLPGSRGR